MIDIILIAPAANTISERDFSTLKRIRTSITPTVLGSRLNHFLMKHIFKEELDELDVNEKQTSVLKLK